MEPAGDGANRNTTQRLKLRKRVGAKHRAGKLLKRVKVSSTAATVRGKARILFVPTNGIENHLSCSL